MENCIRILMAEDLLTDAKLAEREVKKTLPTSQFQRVETRQEYLHSLEEFRPDLIISDYHMPAFDGMMALKLAIECCPLTPVIILTGALNEDTSVECMKAGAADYVIKEHIKRLGQAVVRALEEKEIRKQRFQAEAALRDSEERYRTLVETLPDAVTVLDLQGKINYVSQSTLQFYGFETDTELIGRDFAAWVHPAYLPKALEFFNQASQGGVIRNQEFQLYKKDRKLFFGEISASCLRDSQGSPIGVIIIVRDISERKQAEIALQEGHIRLALAYDDTITALSKALDLRDKVTEGHTLRVIDLTLQMARKAGLDETMMDHIRRGALLHDIGKIGIPDTILLKPGDLNDAEWEIMRRHPQYAFNMLSSIDYLLPAINIPLYHHEKWDGTGYPCRLKCEEIPIEARLFAVIDVWDALTSERPYRPAWPREKALAYIRDHAGSHFDPRAVAMFLEVIQQDGEVGN
jgi:PAS domain S-box-containing protein/putative nucleotidyltransferase with HDIG domain